MGRRLSDLGGWVAWREVSEVSYEIVQGDMLDALPKLGQLADAVVTDPPYHFGSIVKRFAKTGGEDRPESRVGAYNRHARGFMGKEWDGGDIAFQPATWTTVMDAMKPGAHLLAFGGTKGFHRMACAIEDAGFEIRDTIMWLYGSGFPKSHNQSGEWEGWGTALKPAYEPIVMARKPLIGTVAANLAAHRTGAINIADSRVGDKDGRWPANVTHDGSDEVIEAFPDARGQIADASTSSSSRKTQNVYGAMTRGNGREGEASAERRYTDEGGTNFAAKPGARRLDSGSAARFFYCAKASRADRNDGLAGLPEKPLLWSSGNKNPGSFQAAGTKKAAQNNHPTVKPTELMRYLCRLVTPPDGLILDPFMGSGSTGRAALLESFRFVGVEREAEYAEIARRRIDAALMTAMAA